MDVGGCKVSFNGAGADILHFRANESLRSWTFGCSESWHYERGPKLQVQVSTREPRQSLGSREAINNKRRNLKL